MVASTTLPPPTAGEASGPITRRTLHDEVVSRVRDMIVDGRLEPGSRLHEGPICEELGVSRTPLREAFKVLASEGLIEILPNRGAVVRAFTPKDVWDTLVVLGHLEALAADLVCKEASETEIAAVRALHDRMMAEYARRNRMEYFKLNQAIHSAIVTLSKNDTLRALHENLQARLKRIRYVGNESAPKWQGAVDDHAEIIAALEARDGARLGAILRQHMMNTWTRVSQTLGLHNP
jgi:DNA-binding GntR family transcriptional regulator